MKHPSDQHVLDDQQILDLISNVRCWSSGDQRAPHKPLLLLLALARIQRGDLSPLRYTEIEPSLRELLATFGPPRKAIHPEYPFWRLQADKLWLVSHADDLSPGQNSSGNVSASRLRLVDATGEFPPLIGSALASRPDLVNRLASQILESTFPPSLHQSILDAVDFPWTFSRRRTRDPEFRHLILRIYEHRCAVCGWDARLGTADLALDAAHVKWHAAGGPDTAENGLALCSLHHVLFDRGALGISRDLRILVSQNLNGGQGVNGLVDSLSGRALRSPQQGSLGLARPFIDWHSSEVFSSPSRSH